MLYLRRDNTKKEGIYIMADSLKTLICPACGKTMEKVFIPSQGINLDICTQGCGGIYFDNREFDNFDEQHEDISEILAKIANKTFEKTDTTKTRICPNCGAKMVKNSTSVFQKIEVDDCYSCGGKFLDNEELVKIREEYVNNEARSADLLQYVYTTVGSEISELDRRNEAAVAKRDLAQKLFYKIMGL